MIRRLSDTSDGARATAGSPCWGARTARRSSTLGETTDSASALWWISSLAASWEK
ncbi:hypothetical protein ROS62_26910 [Streptomyces sp. DSM 41972]|uniref:Uncharacterized protein n=1 Tax=Streptomyces althioticus subsp. attaecolombicae TaxID=3075534 RepID=A0ABU3I5T6_9ACTN|nr:hypothetical protein [Streptomyces sp. DSM 41972]